VEKALRNMVQVARELGIGRVGLPRIGAGLGGLPWETVRELVERVGTETELELVVFEEYVPGA